MVSDLDNPALWWDLKHNFVAMMPGLSLGNEIFNLNDFIIIFF